MSSFKLEEDVCSELLDFFNDERILSFHNTSVADTCMNIDWGTAKKRNKYWQSLYNITRKYGI